MLADRILVFEFTRCCFKNAVGRVFLGKKKKKKVDYQLNLSARSAITGLHIWNCWM